MNEFRNLQEDWGEYLKQKGEIASPEHLVFFRRLQDVLLKNPQREDINEGAFYIQQEAGFYRFRVLELMTKTGEKYQVNFHVFQEGKTHIHSHGYEGCSFVLNGTMSYKNFILNKVSQQRQSDLEKMFPYAFLGRENPQKVAEQVFQELEELILGQRVEVSFNTMIFAAFLSGGNDEDFGTFTLPKNVMNILRDAKGMFYELQETQSLTVKKGESYTVGMHEAHKVIVPEQAKTLFLTHTPGIKTQVLPGGEFYHFRLPNKAKKSSVISLKDARKILTTALLDLNI